MKKSFMTRALAMGLSVAMAFSLSTATNVTMASAAAKPAMKSTSFKVVEGASAKTYKATAKTAKKYTIVKAESENAKKVTAEKKNKKAILIEATGKKFGAAKVTVTFKNKETGKKTSIKFAGKAIQAEAYTMTAEATGVKEITVNFNKAVADTSTVTVTVKKGAATPTITSTTWAADKASAEILLGTKMTEGTYTVAVAGLADADLTADVAVKDETLTSFELVSTNLVAAADATTKASISYKALNQYGDMMVADAPNVTCTFGTVDEVKPATADASGKITVKGINEIMTVPETVGTIVLVDSKTGVNLNTQITYKTKAVASSATVYGIYSFKTEKLIEGNLSTGAKASDYAILVSVKDQYDSYMTPEGIATSGADVTFNAAKVMTDLEIAGTDPANKKVTDALAEITYEGASCFLIPLAASEGAKTDKVDAAGTLSLTMVSAQKGVLATPSFTVDEAKIIKTLSISPKSTIYAGQKNEMILEAYDANGEAITKYDELIAARFNENNIVKLEKKADGTAALFLDLSGEDFTGDEDGKYKNSNVTTVTYYANSNTSSDYLVKTGIYTYYAQRQAWTVSGITKDTVTACASGEAIKFDLDSLDYEDQYSNVVKTGTGKSDAKVASVSAILVDKDGVFGAATEGAVQTADGDNVITLTSAGKKGSATLYLKYANAIDDDAVTTDKYDLKVTVSVTDVSDTVTSDLKVIVNGGNAMYASTTAIRLSEGENKDATKANADTTASVAVQAVVNGKTVILPDTQFTVVTDAINGVGDPAKEKKTETRTVTVVVESESGPQTVTADVTVSNEDAKITTIKKADGGVDTASGSGVVTAAELIDTVKVVDQYGNAMSAQDANLTYTVTMTGANANDAKVAYNATQNVRITAETTGEYYATVVFATKDGKVSFTRDIKVAIN